MFDELRPDELPEPSRRTPDGQRPAADREVPIEPQRIGSTDALHAWLDGEATESSARREERSGDVEFWKALGADLLERRRLRAPAGLQARIMAAILVELPG